jgi:Mg2+/Co2+ transporter CorB
VSLTIPQLLLVFAVGLVFSAIFSMVEAAVISQDRHRLEHLAMSGKRSAQIMQTMLGGIDRLLAAILLFNNIANVLCATTATVIVTRLSGGGETAAFVASLGVAFLILVVSEISPKVIGVRHAQTISLVCAVPLHFLLAVFHPVIVVANFFARGILLLAGVRHANVLNTAMNTRELHSAVRASRAQAAQDSQHGKHYKMVEQALHLGNIPVEKIMTPRRHIKGINLQNGDNDAYDAILSADYAKLLIYESNPDNAAGFVDTIQALKIATRQGRVTAADLRRIVVKPLFMPAAANAVQQLQNMRTQNSRAALVVDGAGRVTGMVTLANFAAAIIGGSTAPPTPTTEGDFILPGDFSLLQLSELLPDIQLPDTSATNLNGLIMEVLGDIPDTSVCVEIAGMRFEIIETGNKSVRRARLLKPAH